MENKTQPKAFGSLNEYAQPNLNNAGLNNSSASVYADQRRQDINQQLQAMKSNVSNIKLKSQDMRDLAADKLYPQNQSPNIKKRSDGITVDTSSSDSSTDSSKANTESSSGSGSGSGSSSSTSSSSEEVKAKSKSSNGTGSVSSKKNVAGKNQIEKSLSSRNNQSSYSKRKYKKAGITIDT
jgi:hypothetical protein